MSSLKVFRRMPTQLAETGRSDSSDACSGCVIRGVRITHAGVTAGTTAGGVSFYTRRRRQGMSGGRFPGVRRRPLSGDMPATPSNGPPEGGPYGCGFDQGGVQPLMRPSHSPLLFSSQEYSSSGVVMSRNVRSLVHGFVYVFGSSTVTV